MTNWAKHTQSSLYYTLCTNNWLRNWIEQSATTSWIFRIHPNYLVIYPYTFKNFFSLLNTYTKPIHLLHLSRCLNKHLHTKFIQFSWAIRINRSKKNVARKYHKKIRITKFISYFRTHHIQIFKISFCATKMENNTQSSSLLRERALENPIPSCLHDETHIFGRVPWFFLYN